MSLLGHPGSVRLASIAPSPPSPGRSQDQLEGFSIFGSEPLGKAEWFGKLQKAAKEPGRG